MNAVDFDGSFQPPVGLRGAHLQSVLPSLPPLRALIRRRAAALLAQERELILDCGAGVRLQAFHTAGGSRPDRLAVLLHGWEGSAGSSNVLSLGACLFERGYALMRLNLRDHGATHHLNRELFHSCRLAEVVGAVNAIARQFSGARLYLAGFSLGGNFMLRVAADAGIPSAVATAAAVSPVLDPARTLSALEQGWSLYRRHFVRLWSKSLRAKARAWPGTYDFSEMLRVPTLRPMTADLVKLCTDFASLEAYLAGYAITGERLARLHVPASMLLAADDPIIPLHDLSRIARSPRLTLSCTRLGGHCGFLERATRSSFADRFVLEQFERHE